MCLPPHCRIAGECSQVVEHDVVIDEELDFWVDGTLEWAIELLRQGDRKGKHIHNMETKYADLEPTQSRLVDFRESNNKPRGLHPNYVAVLVANDFKSAQVLFPGKKKSQTVHFNGEREEEITDRSFQWGANTSFNREIFLIVS